MSRAPSPIPVPVRRVFPPHRDPALQAVAEARLGAWLAPGLRLSAGVPCLRRLARGSCHHSEACVGRTARWQDHVHGWTRGGRLELRVEVPVVRLRGDRHELLADLAGLGLTYTVDPARSWWFPGRTTLIVVQRAARAGGTGVAEMRARVAGSIPFAPTPFETGGQTASIRCVPNRTRNDTPAR